MSAIDKLISNYIKEIKKNLLCPTKQKKQVLADIENSIKDFTLTHNITNINEIYAQFGTPQDVANAYMTEINLKEIKRKIFLRKVIIIIAAVFIALLFVFCIKAFLATYRLRFDVIYVTPALEGTTEYLTDEVLL